MQTPENGMRVGYVVKRYPRFSETFIVNEILSHEARGLDVEIFSLRPPADTHFQDGIARVRARVNYVPNKGAGAMAFWAATQRVSLRNPELWNMLEAARGESGNDVYQALALSELIHEQGITHLHAHFATLATTVARLAAKFAGITYSFTAHAKDIFHQSVDYEDVARKLRDASAVVTVSDFNAAFLASTYGNDASNVRRIYNGIDLSSFEFQSPLQRPPRIVAVGRLVEKKGFAVLIHACSVLKARGYSFTCQIIGGGDDEDDLRELIRRLGVGHLVELLGPRPQREVKRLIQSASVMVAPCISGTDGNRDGLPTVLIEAMALGTPCVATSVTGIPEIVHDNVTGLIVDEREPTALADAIANMLTAPELRERLAESARQLVEREFDIDQNASWIRDMFHTSAGFPASISTVGDPGGATPSYTNAEPVSVTQKRA